MRSNRIDEALYGVEYSLSRDPFQLTNSETGLDSCNSCQDKGEIIMLRADSSEFVRFIISQSQAPIMKGAMIIKSLNSKAFVLASPESCKQSFKFVGFDPMGNITKHQVLLNYGLGNNALSINFRLPSGLSNKITFDVNTGKADLGPGFIPTLPEARITWDDRWNNCMSKRVPDGPVSGVGWVLSWNIFLDLGDCIGSASGWW